MSGPVETELPPASAFRRRELRLPLTLNRSPAPGPSNNPGSNPTSPVLASSTDLKNQVRTIDCHELARRVNANSHNKQRLPFILLDCRGYLNYMANHIKGAVHIACSDRFNRKRVRNSGSVLDLVISNNNRWSVPNQGSKYHHLHHHHHNNGIYNTNGGHGGKYRDIIVYDEGTSDLNFEASWANPISFVLQHLLQENRLPIYLAGGIKEFDRVYHHLCESSTNASLDLNTSGVVGTSGGSLGAPMMATSPSSPYLPTLSPSTDWNCSTSQCHESYENEPPTQVLPFLYVGNARDSCDVELLNRLNIRYILSVTRPVPGGFPYGSNNNENSRVGTKPDISSTSPTSHNNNLSKDGFRTKLIPVSDNLRENLAPYFEEACDFIEEAHKSGSSILIHCQAGISRSPTIAIAYIMKHLKLSTHEAYGVVQRARRIISPNLNFMGQLIEFESKLKNCENWPSQSCSDSNSTGTASEPSSASCSESSSCESSIDLQMESRRHELESSSSPVFAVD